ncbi:MAG: FkbM family methyltransferase [Roseiarcus sp.]
MDVGAHVGIHTLRFADRVREAGHVMAVEPSPANARLLRTHLVWSERHNVSVIEAAVGEAEGEIEFTFRQDPFDLEPLPIRSPMMSADTRRESA